MRISDWSSDVCSSDLQARLSLRLPWRISVTLLFLVVVILMIGLIAVGGLAVIEQLQKLIVFLQNAVKGLLDFVTELRSDERRVGKECVGKFRSRWAPDR